ncbi:MAG: hypothetical protein WC525_04975 [Candidatus Thermoplasmatota archaeon]
MANEKYLQTKIQELFMIVEQQGIELNSAKLKLASLERQNESLMEEFNKRCDTFLQVVKKANEEAFVTLTKAFMEKLTEHINKNSPDIIAGVKTVLQSFSERMETHDRELDELRKQYSEMIEALLERTRETTFLLLDKDVFTEADTKVVLNAHAKYEKTMINKKLSERRRKTGD